MTMLSIRVISIIVEINFKHLFYGLVLFLFSLMRAHFNLALSFGSSLIRKFLQNIRKFNKNTFHDAVHERKRAGSQNSPVSELRQVGAKGQNQNLQHELQLIRTAP